MQYVWLSWSLILLAFWLMVHFVLLHDSTSRRKMLKVSLWSMPTGLLQPLFIPEYWNPPSLFNLTATVGFDIESLIFSFAVGGIGSMGYKLFIRRELVQGAPEKVFKIPQPIMIALLFTGPIFLLIMLYWLKMNPIYPSLGIFFYGSLLILGFRPDLWQMMLVGAGVFCLFYFVAFQVLLILSPGYVQEVWNLPALFGISVANVPLEEMIYAFGAGSLFSGIYDYVYGTRLK